jgi:hypothetical protein
MRLSTISNMLPFPVWKYYRSTLKAPLLAKRPMDPSDAFVAAMFTIALLYTSAILADSLCYYNI